MSPNSAAISQILSSAHPSQAGAGTAAIPANMQINEADFLKLITSQLQNQNPMQPTDPSQFLGQLEGLSEVSSLQGMQSTMSSSQVTNGAGLLGHSVLAPGTTATLAAGGAIAGAVNAPGGATSLTVSIASASGAPVTSFQVTPAASGMTAFSWNGATGVGTSAAPGRYTVSVHASINGTSQSVPPMVVSQVQSVTVDPSTQQLDLNTDGGTVPLSSVVTIM